METQLSVKPGTILFSSPELSAASSAPQQLSGTWHCSAGRGAVGGEGLGAADRQTDTDSCVLLPFGSSEPGLQLWAQSRSAKGRQWHRRVVRLILAGSHRPPQLKPAGFGPLGKKGSICWKRRRSSEQCRNPKAAPNAELL